MKPAQNIEEDPHVLLIERIFDAPRERVFKAWTHTDDALQWGGPRDYPLVATEADLRPGGRWRSVLRSVEDGSELPQGGIYEKISEPEVLSFTFAWKDPEEDNPETLVTIRFEDLSGKTRMQFRQEPFDTRELRDGHREGWNSAFDRLDEWLHEGHESPAHELGGLEGQADAVRDETHGNRQI